MVAKRIIPCLDVDQGRVVKGVKFIDNLDAGDLLSRPGSTTTRVLMSSSFSTLRQPTKIGALCMKW